MDQDIKRRWVEALRSGNYQQGEGYLERNGKFCCLGVLCKIVSGVTPSFNPEQTNGCYPVTSDYDLVDSLLGLGDFRSTTFWELNDTRAWTFAQIADYIEANL